MATKALKRTTGINIVLNPARYLSERTGGGLTSEMRGGETRTRVVALAFAAISGPERSGGVRSPTICEEVGPETLVGVR